MKQWMPQVAIMLLASFAARTYGQSLNMTYGSKGVQTISFAGVTLEDTGAYPADTFHIWHVSATDLAGNALTAGQYGWGENNSGEIWNSSTHTETYTFSWGSVSTQFAQNGDNLDMIVTETNNTGSGIVLNGVEILPFALHFPLEPTGFYGVSQYAITTTGPGVSIADYGLGVVTSVIPNEALALYGGWKNAGTASYSPIMTATAPDGLATFLPRINSPVQPGGTLTYTVSLRFTPEGKAADASDAYASSAATYPSQMTWTDKRIIGTTYLASSPAGTGDITQPGGYPTNPRRYFNDPTIDITSLAGLKAFQDRILAQANSNVANAKGLNSQGVITWDLEGEEYPQTTSYVCSPDQVAAIAPEMESVVADSTSPYYGSKLDDAYFSIMTNAGLRVGLCLRPQVFTLGPNNTASQNYITGNSNLVANLENKAKYANSRWGVTLFYVDTTVDVNGGTLDPAIFQQLITDMPSFLFIPEESTPRYYAYTAPFYSFIFHTTLGTAASTYAYYPHAFGANLVNDVAAATLATYTPQLSQSVKSGDILMGHADYWQTNDPTLVAIYQAAGITGPAPVQTKPAINWSTPSAISYGTPLSSAQLNAVASVPGTYSYTAQPGTILPAGSSPVMVTFTPTDSTHYTTATAWVTLTVVKSNPVVTWATPPSLSAGSPLSSTQLNASANVPGTFVYTPAAGTIPAVGTDTLSVTFTPTDTTDYNTVTLTTSLTDTPVIVLSTPATPVTGGVALNSTASSTVKSTASTPKQTSATATKTKTPKGNLAILTPGPSAKVSGLITVTGYVNLALDSAGTYLMVDGQEVGTHRVISAPFVYPLDTSTLSAGKHTLQLWGHDISNNVTLSQPVAIDVKP